MEIWKDCKGYEDLYQISNQGRVWSVKRQKYLKPLLNTKGYLYVGLQSKNGKRKTEYIHRLVAIAFIDNPNNLPQVNHKDEDRQNNCVDNLEWCDSKYNNNYGSRNENVSKGLSKAVFCVELNKTFDSITHASIETNISISCISKACSGKQKTAGKYHWRVVNYDKCRYAQL